MALKVGDSAPDFTLTSGNGTPISLKDFGGKPVVLYFYPKDDTPGCTAQACGFRDQYAVFQELGAEVLGVSSDSEAAHQKFAAAHALPFPLLCDQGGKLRKLYGVPTTLGILPGRVTYVIDKQGMVRHIFNAQLNFGGHIEAALKVLKEIQAEV
jgi:thioredoxin-dependent peroxiredoxin